MKSNNFNEEDEFQEAFDSSSSESEIGDNMKDQSLYDKILKLVFNEKIKYLFWGVMTTLVYLVVRFVAMMIFKTPFIPVAIAQVVSIIFAFFVNRSFVFNNQQSRSLTEQLFRFSLGRALVAGIDFVLTYILIDHYANNVINLLGYNHLNYNGGIFSIGIVDRLIGSPVLLNSFISVLFIQVVAFVANYITSKYFAFD